MSEHIKIKKCTISAKPRPIPEGMFDPAPIVSVEYDDGTSERLFEYYHDELSFSENEFIGLTRDEAYALKQKKDKEFLKL